jgi:ribosomal protein L11 methylase PrmA
VTSALRDAGSFRDPSGYVYHHEGRVFRTVNGAAVNAYRALESSGLLKSLVDRGLLLGADICDPAALPLDGDKPALLLEHPRLPFISHPYEWCFAAHRAAALAHLDLHLAALAAGFTLSDASAYNIQFIGPKPVFIDHLSLRPYQSGEIWAGHRQFCMQFLNPLVLEAKLGISPRPWFRGALEGIDPADLAKLLGWRHCLSWALLAHVFLQARFQSGALSKGADAKLRDTRLPLNALKNMLQSLRSYIAGLKKPGTATVWSDYADNTSYTDTETTTKRRFVSAMVSAIKPARIIDLGCNTGAYSELALSCGAGTVLGFDFDTGALDQAFQRATQKNLSFLPLWLDAANPSPDQGWGQAERKGFAARARADGLLALALLHHLVIGRNIPMDDAVGWLMAMAPQGIIEFVPKSDPMVQRLLSLREDIFPDYVEDAFRAAILRRGRIRQEEHVAAGGRLLLWYDAGATVAEAQ